MNWVLDFVCLQVNVGGGAIALGHPSNRGLRHQDTGHAALCTAKDRTDERCSSTLHWRWHGNCSVHRKNSLETVGSVLLNLLHALFAVMPCRS